MPLGNQFTAQAGNYAPIETYTNEFVWGRDYNIIRTGSVMSSVARDIGATPTTILRAGLVVGTITATNKLREYAAINTDGVRLPPAS